ncbi:MAG: hypothetical protein AAGI10_14395, partial [Pseudomonadota bacterium]
VAAWATVSENGLARLFEKNVADGPQVSTAALSFPDDTDPAPDIAAIAPAPLDRSLLDPPKEVLPDSAVEEGEEAIPDSELSAASTPAPSILSEAELQRLYAATGIWQRAPAAPSPPVPSELDSFYLTSIDTALTTGDAVALEAPEAFDSDRRLAGQTLPPAPDLRFAFDSDGRIVATAEGALSPLGFTVYAGRPTVTPPLRVPEEKVQEDQFARLAAFRPQARPETLIEDTERQQLGGLSRAELAVFRPQLRPETAKAPEEIIVPDAPASQLAVANSLRPNGRPRNAEQIIANTRASQPSTVAVAAPVAPRVTSPTAPTRASVARAATTSNAIRLRRVNLIGVYGKPASRSALVRLANGRFVKVQVGDKMDGGTVAAISESALRYVKRGRNITLEIPTG